MPVQSLSFRAAIAAIAALAAMAIPACAMAAAIDVPEKLQPAANQQLALEAHAVGVQIYTCSAAEGGKTGWTLKAPEATLYDDAGTKLARHYGGPTWESVDGSKVVGKVKASATPDDSAIAWLLLDVKSAQGEGSLGKVSAVQRLATEAGKAPADGCAKGDLGKEVQVPYKAVYRFYTTR
jgi:hypothetical protein